MHSKLKRCLHMLFIVAFALVLSGCGMMVKYREAKPKIMAGKKEEMVIKKPVSDFRVGEKLTYSIYWHGIPVGFATTEVKDIVTINGRQAYHLVGIARSNSYLRFIFRVEDTLESFVDKETFLTLRHIVKRQEGKYRSHWIMDYDWENQKLNFKNLADNSEKILPLPEKAEDQFSAFYYFRTMELYLVEPKTFFVNQGEKNWKIEIPVKSTGKMSLPGLGNFDAFMIEPVPYLDGKPLDKGKAWVWFSNDERRIPLMIKIHVNVRLLGVVLVVLQRID